MVRSGKSSKKGDRRAGTPVKKRAKDPSNAGASHKDDKHMTQTLKEWREFAKTYNDFKNLPLKHDLLRVLFPGKSDDEKSRLLRNKKRRYAVYRAAHPEQGLPELILRDNRKGALIAIPNGVLEQLAEFRIDADKLRHAKGVIVTSAQYGAPLNGQFWKSLQLYAAHMGYELVVMPIKYGQVKTVFQKELQRRILTSTFDPALKGYMLFEGQEIAGGALNLNVMRMRPTLKHFLTDDVCSDGGNTSQIFAAPKLELQFRPRLAHDYPKAIMTSGAVTHPNYNVDNIGQQDRTGELAANAHTYAAIVVEFSAKKTFHFRQLLANKEGEFYDINPKHGGAIFVTAKGIEERQGDVVAAYLGDLHWGVTHPDVLNITFGNSGMLQTLRPDHVITSDAFDGDSVSHWDKNQAQRRAHKARLSYDSLKAELDGLVKGFRWMKDQLPGATHHTIASNHNEFLLRWLESMDWTHDDVNLAMGAELFSMLQKELEERDPALHDMAPVDPVNLWLNKHAPFVVTHDRRSKLLLPEGIDAMDRIMCSLHGDIGPKGRRAGIKSFYKWNQRIIIGHAHSAMISGPVWRVGTMTHLMEHYVNSPGSDWTHTHCLIYKNGQRQLINIMNGTWHGQTKRRPKSAGLGTGIKGKRVDKAARSAKK